MIELCQQQVFPKYYFEVLQITSLICDPIEILMFSVLYSCLINAEHTNPEFDFYIILASYLFLCYSTLSLFHNLH